jgi:hypothetical protein
MIKFEGDSETTVDMDNEGHVVVWQEDGEESEICFWFSPARARFVAAAMMRLADEFDARKGDAQ